VKNYRLKCEFLEIFNVKKYKLIPKNPCGFIDNNCNGGPVRAEVSHL